MSHVKRESQFVFVITFKLSVLSISFVSTEFNMSLLWCMSFSVGWAVIIWQILFLVWWWGAGCVVCWEHESGPCCHFPGLYWIVKWYIIVFSLRLQMHVLLILLSSLLPKMPSKLLCSVETRLLYPNQACH